MNIAAKTCFTVLAGVAMAAVVQTASAVPIQNFQLNLPGGPLDINLNSLGFGGESYVANSGTGPVFTFTDNGVFNFTTKNGGPVLGLGGGQLTANYYGATGTATAGGSLVFNAGGKLDFYYNSSVTFGSSAANRYGATDGTLIASFTQLAGLAGSVNPDGTPNANGNLSLDFMASYLQPGVWSDSAGNALPTDMTLGFVTTNAHEDTAANCSVASQCAIDPNLVAALGGVIPNAPPATFLVQNGGQFTLEAVPEPGSVTLIGLGLGMLAMVRRRYRA